MQYIDAAPIRYTERNIHTLCRNIFGTPKKRATSFNSIYGIYQSIILYSITEAKIKANAQQTLGNYEIYSGSSGGLIRLEANEVGFLTVFNLTSSMA